MTDLRHPAKYADPPVSEVVFSVQFAPVHELSLGHLGAWWSTGDNRERFPASEEQPPVEPQVETFEQPGPSFSIDVRLGTPPSALRFLSANRDEAVQMQKDRYTHSWIKTSAENAYPSYEQLRPRFLRELRDFEDFLVGEGLQALTPTQCELSYINAVTPNRQWSAHSELERILAPWGGGTSEEFLPEPENVSVRLAYVARNSGGEPVARLHVQVDPVFDQRSRPAYLLSLTFRGDPKSDNTEVGPFLDLGHEWIVSGFTAVTTSGMHEEWGRQ